MPGYVKDPKIRLCIDNILKEGAEFSLGKDDSHYLLNVMRLGAGEEITLREVEAQLSSDSPSDEPLVKQDLLAMPLREAREHFERAYLQQQLILCGGKVGQLAKRVGMERTHLYRKLRSLGVDFRQVMADD